MRPLEWTTQAELPEPKKLDAGKWTPVTLEVARECDHGVVSSRIDATVEAKAGVRDVTLDVLPSDADALRQHLLSGCRPEETEVFVDISSAVAKEPHDAVLPMEIGLTFFSIGTGSVDLRDITTPTDRLSVEALNLPNEIADTDEQPPEWHVDLNWRVTDCSMATTFTDVEIDLIGPDGDSVSTGRPTMTMPASGAVDLARFVMEQWA